MINPNIGIHGNKVAANEIPTQRMLLKTENHFRNR
jgi:hypothetical protein